MTGRRTTPLRVAAANERRAFDRGWIAAAQLDDKGRPRGNLFNAMLAMRGAPELRQAFAFDEMRGTPMVMSDLPGQLPEAAEPWACATVLGDRHITQVQEWLQGQGLPSLGQQTAHQAIEFRARERRFHPVREWLESLSWDGVDRLGEWTATYLGAAPGRYSSEIGRMMLVGMVARIFDPGCKLDHMAVLEGPQGAFKSSACRILGAPWYSDSLPDISSGKDVQIHLAGLWLIEIGELSAMSRADGNHLKSFISRQVEKYRPPFARVDIEQPRQCVFVGTTNAAVYLKDETGGRRFWPIKVGSIDLAALKVDREQLFAEAVWRYRDGEKWYPDQGFEAEFIKPEQEARRTTDAWFEEVSKYLTAEVSVTVGGIAKGALDIDKARIDRTTENRIMSILEELGWERGQRTKHGRPWVRRALVSDIG